MTATPEYIGGSFRDPNGRVFEHRGQIYRTIANTAADDFNAVVESGLFDDLVRDGLLVGWSKADPEIFLVGRARAVDEIFSATRFFGRRRDFSADDEIFRPTDGF